MRQVIRQNDQNFPSILTKIGHGQRLEDDEVKLIESRFEIQERCDEHMNDQFFWVFFSNVEVAAYNIKYPQAHNIETIRKSPLRNSVCNRVSIYVDNEYRCRR